MIFHWHHFEITSVMHGHDPMGGALTAVLQVCRCGEFKSKTIVGRWTVEDFTRKPVTDLEIAKQLGVKL